MKMRNAIQVVWPSLWLAGFTFTLFTKRELSDLPLAVASLVWVVSALVLHPRRKWSWWTCFTPLAACSLFGIACFGGLIHVWFFPDYWDGANQPGAILILGGLMFLVPSMALLAHLFLIRGQFRQTPAVRAVS